MTYREATDEFLSGLDAEDTIDINAHLVAQKALVVQAATADALERIATTLESMDKKLETFRGQ